MRPRLPLPLFVYGTLRSARVRAAILQGTREVESAVLVGWRILERAVRDRYRGIRPEGSARAAGLLVHVQRGDFARLDAYEAAPRLYRRRRLRVRVRDGHRDCWVYVPRVVRPSGGMRDR